MVLNLLIGLLLLTVAVIIIYFLRAYKKHPAVPVTDLTDYQPVQKSDRLLQLGNNWCHHNSRGLYEMYIEGSPYERGIINGRLTEKLIYTQENVFIEEIKRRIPNNFYLQFLKIVSLWMNRKLKGNISNEYDLEIYGVSLSASPKFRMIGPGYLRILNYHAAHDIAHALVNINLVGCTAFVASGKQSADGKIIHARNFDFYAGDEFCKEKIISFYAPDHGNKFAMITWGGLVGTVSGMNMQGLAITVNAAKSKMPRSITTPVTILVREMLQYAGTIEEALAIARKRTISVSESFLVSSGRDNKALIIEKTPYQTEIFDPDNSQIICTNHFQSEALKNDPMNMRQINDTASMYRYQRTRELVEQSGQITVEKAVEILRNRLGLENKPIGNGNEYTLNQLLAHHGIIFKPCELKMWVSAGPFNLGEFLCYDLNEVFGKPARIADNCNIITENQVIPGDPMLTNGEYKGFERFKQIRKELLSSNEKQVTEKALIEEMISLNQEYFLSYSTAGDYLRRRKDYANAASHYRIALQKEIPNKKEKEEIRKHLDFCVKKTGPTNG
ncbi:MAG TPA: C45 family autoproteolytic acyltransferase/hydrolase [Bacteroidales bacterium]|nr:C45 family autoproteolytic acyltransferase/hydrolase [Bacteroidales bacterium]